MGAPRHGELELHDQQEKDTPQTLCVKENMKTNEEKKKDSSQCSPFDIIKTRNKSDCNCENGQESGTLIRPTVTRSLEIGTQSFEQCLDPSRGANHLVNGRRGLVASPLFQLQKNATYCCSAIIDKIQ